MSTNPEIINRFDQRSDSAKKLSAKDLKKQELRYAAIEKAKRRLGEILNGYSEFRAIEGNENIGLESWFNRMHKSGSFVGINARQIPHLLVCARVNETELEQFQAKLTPDDDRRYITSEILPGSFLSLLKGRNSEVPAINLQELFSNEELKKMGVPFKNVYGREIPEGGYGVLRSLEDYAWREKLQLYLDSKREITTETFPLHFEEQDTHNNNLNYQELPISEDATEKPVQKPNIPESSVKNGQVKRRFHLTKPDIKRRFRRDGKVSPESEISVSERSNDETIEVPDERVGKRFKLPDIKSWVEKHKPQMPQAPEFKPMSYKQDERSAQYKMWSEQGAQPNFGEVLKPLSGVKRIREVKISIPNPVQPLSELFKEVTGHTIRGKAVGDHLKDIGKGVAIKGSVSFAAGAVFGALGVDQVYAGVLTGAVTSMATEYITRRKSMSKTSLALACGTGAAFGPLGELVGLGISETFGQALKDAAGGVASNALSMAGNAASMAGDLIGSAGNAKDEAWKSTSSYFATQATNSLDLVGGILNNISQQIPSSGESITVSIPDAIAVQTEAFSPEIPVIPDPEIVILPEITVAEVTEVPTFIEPQVVPADIRPEYKEVFINRGDTFGQKLVDEGYKLSWRAAEDANLLAEHILINQHAVDIGGLSDEAILQLGEMAQEGDEDSWNKIKSIWRTMRSGVNIKVLRAA